MFEKGLEPKKPREADKGEGWALCSCSALGSACESFWACLPHSKATGGCGSSLSALRMLCTIGDHPRFWWEPASPAVTESTWFSSSTPWESHGLRSGCGTGAMPRIRLQLLVDIGQGAGQGTNLLVGREGKSIGMPGRRIRVLANN